MKIRGLFACILAVLFVLMVCGSVYAADEGGEECMSTFIDPTDDVEKSITYCNDYSFIGARDSTKETQCNNDCNDAYITNREIEEQNLGDGETITDAACVWLLDNTGVSKCVFSFNVESCSNGVCGGDCRPCPDGKVCNSNNRCVTLGNNQRTQPQYPDGCIKDITGTGQSIGGFMTSDYIYKKIDGGVLKTKAELCPECSDPDSTECLACWDCDPDGSMEVPSQMAIQDILPFFSAFNMICAMAGIALIYVVYLFKKEFLI
jgi:hypothetical protein